MNEYDEILVFFAKKHMVQFDIDSFKKSHPKLYITIVESMKCVKNPST